MAEAREPGPVLFLTGVLAAEPELFSAVRLQLEQCWGSVAATSPIWPFDHTSYYRKESGEGIQRMFLAFGGKFSREELATRKLQSNAIELDFSTQKVGSSPRPVNIDPGYLAPEKLVLASCKNFAHRIYIGQGVFAEPTLLYRHGRFEALEWTFPDYAAGRYFPFFEELRRNMMREWYA